MTALVDTIRSLFTRAPVHGDTWTALAWCLGILVVANLFALRRYRRRAA